MSSLEQAMTKRESRSEDSAARGWGIRIAIVSAASLLALCALAALSLRMVAAGRGLETHHSAWLVEDSWLGFLVFMAVCVVAVLAGLMWRLLQQRREALVWREHEAKWADSRKRDG